MHIQELEDKHKEIIGESDLYYPEYLHNDTDEGILYSRYLVEEDSVAKEATKLSVEFAISILETEKIKLAACPVDKFIIKELNNKIQELKQYLDEE